MLARAEEAHAERVERVARGVRETWEQPCQRAVEHVDERHVVRAGERRGGLGADQPGAHDDDPPAR